MKTLIKLIILVVLIKQIVWISFIPLWQFPDEQAHFGQVAYMSSQNNSPTANSLLNKEIFTSEQILGTQRDPFGNNRFTYHPEYNIPYSKGEMGYFEEEIINIPRTDRDIFVISEATAYPPLYYFLASIFYKLIPANLITSVFIARLLNIVYTVLLIILAYNTYSLIFNSKSTIILGTLIVSFHPMLSFLQAGFNSDNIYNLLAAAIIYSCILLLKKGITLNHVILSAIITILALYSKPQSYILILFFLFPYARTLWSKRKSQTKLTLSIVLLTIISPFIINYLSETAYFPEVNIAKLANNPNIFWGFLKSSLIQSYRQTLPWYWGIYRWLSLSYSINVYRVLNIASFVMLIGTLTFVYKTIIHKKYTFQFTALLFFLYSCLTYFFVLTVWDFSFFLTKGFPFGIQGRYYFPLIVAQVGILLIGAQTLGNIKVGLGKILYSTLGIGIIILHEYAFIKVVTSYYPVNNLSNFFLIASQYKPFFFKSPFLIYILIIHALSLITLPKHYLSLILHERSSLS